MADLAQEEGYSVWHALHSALPRGWGLQAVAQAIRDHDPVVVAALALPVAFLVAGFTVPGKGARAGGGRKVERMDYTSELMCRGPYPSTLEMPATILNLCLSVDSIPTMDALREMCTRLFDYDRFRSVPVKAGFLGLYLGWEKIEVHPDDIITSVKVNGAAAVKAEIERIKEVELHPGGTGGKDLPLWAVHLVEDVSGVDSILMLRVHHALCDGLSMAAIAGHIVRGLDGEPVHLPLPLQGQTRGGGGGGGGVIGALANLLRVALKLPAALYEVAVSPLRRDTPLPFGDFTRVRSGSGGDGGGMVYRGRRMVLLPDVPLALVKRLKNAVRGATVNDVVIAWTTGAIRRYCEAQGGGGGGAGGGLPPEGRLVTRASIPVALPGRPLASDFSHALLNKWFLVSVDMHMREVDPRRRVAAICATTARMKGSLTAVVQQGLQNFVLPYVPMTTSQGIVQNVLGYCTMLLTNVPGPQQPLTVAGVRIRRVHMIYAASVRPQVTCVSYDGLLSTSFVVDPATVASCDSLRRHALEELEALCAYLVADSESTEGDLASVRAASARMDATDKEVPAAVAGGTTSGHDFNNNNKVA